MAIADRLGRYADSAVTLAGVPLRDLDPAAVRELILVADNDARLSPGRCATELDARGDADDAALTGALHGGQRHGHRRRRCPTGSTRGRRARPGVLRRPAAAAAAGPGAARRPADPGAGRADQRGRRAHRGPHRRAAGAGAGRPHHRGRAPTSPLVLDRADRVVYVEAAGSSPRAPTASCWPRSPRYAATVTRGVRD